MLKYVEKIAALLLGLLLFSVIYPSIGPKQEVIDTINGGSAGLNTLDMSPNLVHVIAYAVVIFAPVLAIFFSAVKVVRRIGWGFLVLSVMVLLVGW